MNIAINGFGRIGRQAFKVAFAKKHKIVGINDLTDDVHQTQQKIIGL
jgi:glyceraldehyde 3-phosphate dehydrogenase